jgi:hypothetical protein
MIVNLKTSLSNRQGMEALDKRHWQHPSARIATSQPTKVELREIAKFFPLLFISGIFTGIAIMLALTG